MAGHRAGANDIHRGGHHIESRSSSRWSALAAVWDDHVGSEHEDTILTGDHDANTGHVQRDEYRDDSHVQRSGNGDVQARPPELSANLLVGSAVSAEGRYVPNGATSPDGARSQTARSPIRREAPNGAKSQTALSSERLRSERSELPNGGAMRECSHVRSNHDAASGVCGNLAPCRNIGISDSRMRRSSFRLPSLGSRTAHAGSFIDNSCSRPRSR